MASGDGSEAAADGVPAGAAPAGVPGGLRGAGPAGGSRSRSATSSTCWSWPSGSARSGARTGSSGCCGSRGCRWRRAWPALDLKRLPAKVVQQARTLLDGAFVDRGRTCWCSAVRVRGRRTCFVRLAQELVRAGRRVLFATCSLLVQELLVAKRDLKLSRLLKRLAGYEVLLIDDLGYVQQSREEMEVLFTLLAERYERGSVLLTSNLPFSKWESDLQGPDDDGGGDRPAGASQRDRGAERAELPPGTGPTRPATGPPQSRRRRMARRPSPSVVRLGLIRQREGTSDIRKSGKCNCRQGEV